MDDYFVFYRTLLNKGRSGDAQIVSRTAVELMTSDQIASDHRAGSEMFFGDFGSWGFVMSVDIRRDHLFHNPADSVGTAGPGLRGT